MKLAKQRLVTLRAVPKGREFDPTLRRKDCKPVMWMLPIRTARKKQRGFYFPTTADIIVLLCLVGLAGWAAIEGLRWFFSHLTLGWQ